MGNVVSAHKAEVIDLELNKVDETFIDNPISDFDVDTSLSAKIGYHDDAIVSYFKVLNKIGEGSFGIVYLVEKRDGDNKGKLYAMKVLDKAKIRKEGNDAKLMLRTEHEVLMMVRGLPFLAQLVYYADTPEKTYFVLEYEQGGNLFELYTRFNSSNRHFTEEEVKFYIAEMIVGIEQLHERMIVHGDIKLNNILLDAGGHIVISDFGSAKVLTGDRIEEGFLGTLHFMPPEMFNPKDNNVRYDQNVDWWSVGVCMATLLSGWFPFDGDSLDLVIFDILNKPPNISQEISETAKDVIHKLLEKSPDKRQENANKLKKHAFFNSIDWKKVKAKKLEFSKQATEGSGSRTRHSTRKIREKSGQGFLGLSRSNSTRRRRIAKNLKPTPNRLTNARRRSLYQSASKKV